MAVMKETGKHGVILSLGNVVKINLLNVLRYSHITIMRDFYKPTLLFLRLLENVLMWILLQMCLHIKSATHIAEEHMCSVPPCTPE